MAKPRGIFVFLLTCMMFAVSARCFAQHSRSAMLQQASKERVIIDTDIGDDIDDAFAVALALRSTELQILGITTTFGDTEMRAKLLDPCSKKRRARIFPLPQARLHSLRPRLRS